MEEHKPDIVVVLGAGASADFGVPTLSQLFKDRAAREYLKANKSLQRNLEEIFWNPRGINLETSDESLTIEQMLTTLRDLQQQPELASKLPPFDYDSIRRGLYGLIQRAVFRGKSSNRKHFNPIINYARDHFSHTTWASFNWDCLFESSFYYSQPHYQQSGQSRMNPSVVVDLAGWQLPSSRHTFLKLHGGINWWMVRDRLTYVRWTAGGELETRWSEYLSGGLTDAYPVILEPSYYKYSDEAYEHLKGQWTWLINRLANADCVIVIGYSLPDADSMARTTFVSAFQVNPGAPWLVIDPSTETCDRYIQLLGKKNVTALPISLRQFNEDIDDIVAELYLEIA